MPGCEPKQGWMSISRQVKAHLGEVIAEGLVCLDVRAYSARNSISRRTKAHLDRHVVSGVDDDIV